MMHDLSWIPALPLGALLLVAIVVIIGCLSKFGVLNHIIDSFTIKTSTETNDTTTKTKQKYTKNMEPLFMFLQKVDRNYDSIEKIHLKLDTLIKNDDKQETRINSLEKQFRDVQLGIFKKTIYDIKLPLSERMADGLRYLKNDGNGAVRTYVLNTLAQMDITQWNVLCQAMGLSQYSTELNQDGVDYIFAKGRERR